METSSEIVSKDINGVTYTCIPFGARKGLQVLTRLFKVVGGLDDLATLPDLKDMSTGVGLMILSKVVSNITPTQVLSIVDDFTPNCTWTNTEGAQVDLEKTFDSHFARNYNQMIQWFLFVLEANYSSFFGS